MDAAAMKAAQIEREATEWAQEVKQEAKRKSEEMLEDAFNRAWRILDGIDLLESGVGDMIGALRAEMEGFAADLGSRSQAPSDVEAGGGHARTDENGADSTRGSSVVPEVVRSSSSVEQLSEHDANHGEVEQMIIEQVAVMFREGRSRADAERLVMRFKQGEDYLHVVDEIYADDSEGAASPESPPQQQVRWGFRTRRG